MNYCIAMLIDTDKQNYAHLILSLIKIFSAYACLAVSSLFHLFRIIYLQLCPEISCN